MNFQVCSILVLFVTVAVFADDQSKTVTVSPADHLNDPQPPPKPNSTTIAPPTTTSPKTTPSPPTTSTTTTPPPTTTPITTPPTPTPTPTTAPTTPAPTPTTPAPPTSTPAPKDQSWIVKGDNGTYCIIANMVVKISVPYNSSIHNKTVNVDFEINKVDNASSDGKCGSKNQTLILTSHNFTTTFTFVLNATHNTYSLSSVEVNILVNNYTFPNNTMGENVTAVVLKYNRDVFTVSQNYSYTCANVNPLSLSGFALNKTGPVANTTVGGTFTVSRVHIEAFGAEKSVKYSSSIDCVSTETPDIVPIAVGLILAGLVVVVLIAYLVGRRRAQARGYLSM